MSKKPKRDECGESSVAAIINETNGNGHQIGAAPVDRSHFYIMSEKSRKNFAWLIGVCTFALTVLVVYTNFVRDDQAQGDAIRELQKDQKEIKGHLSKATEATTANTIALQKVETALGFVLKEIQAKKP